MKKEKADLDLKIILTDNETGVREELVTSFVTGSVPHVSIRQTIELFCEGTHSRKISRP